MKKPRKSQAPRRIKGVDLTVLNRQCKTVLGREIERLMDASYVDKLSKDDTASLLNYMKYLPELRKQEQEEIDNLTDDQLEALANKEK